MSLHTSYHADSDADDEYERSVITSPHLHIDSESSPTDSDIHSAEHTPTKFGHPMDGPRSPRTLITEWAVDECKEFLTSLGLLQYHGTFRENGIVGEALVALKHEELKEMGINSVGHRLTILKSVYEIKVKQGVPLDADHYIPLSADQSMNETATQEDLARLIKSIQVRDEKLMLVETELRRITDDYRRLREELLPVIKIAKDRSHPLPPPSSGGHPPDNWHDSTATLTSPSQVTLTNDNATSKIARAFSKRMHSSGATPKNNSPTQIPPMIHEGRSHHDALNPSAAALAASSHLSSMNGGSQLSPGIPSPTSPHTHHAHPQTLNPRSYSQPSSGTNRNTAYDYAEQTPTIHSRGDRLTPSQLPSSRAETPSTASRLDPRNDPRTESRAESRAGGGGGSGGGSENPNSVEIFKSFRVSWEDPCYKVLPAALKKYNINSDWKNYALYIVYGDQERCLELQEKPLLLFKQLEKEGRKPMFMLRKIHMDNPAGTPGPGQSAPNSAGFEGGRQGQINLPGGVL